MAIFKSAIILLVFSGCCSANKVFLQKAAADGVLAKFISFTSEIREGNLQRECIEERCNYEEAREIFEDGKKTEIFWENYIHGRNSELVPLLKTAKQILEDQSKINELKKKLTAKKQEISALEDKLLAKLKDCIDGK
ncbi:coagulation factor X-like [Heterodontus francisci]|uniref:coagulation factor X-like n=1 Tax=Heterodontus francisci TaxID=7792 RepID=UPI00355C7EF7